MEALNQLNKKFKNLNFKTKLQLYLLPILILFLFFMTYKNHKEIKVSLPKVKTIDYKFSSIDLISKIQNYANKKSIKILSIAIKNRVINIAFKAKSKDVDKFILFIENIDTNSNILFFETAKIYSSKTNILNAKVKIDFKKSYIKNIKKQSTLSQVRNTKPKLKAIIYNYAFLDNKWRVKGESFSSYKIIQINKNSVILKKDGKKLELKVYNENSFK